MTLLKNGTVKINKDNNITCNGKSIFEIWELLKNDIGSATTWHFWGRLTASTKNEAYSIYLNKKSQEFNDENDEESRLFSGNV